MSEPASISSDRNRARFGQLTDGPCFRRGDPRLMSLLISISQSAIASAAFGTGQQKILGLCYVGRGVKSFRSRGPRCFLPRLSCFRASRVDSIARTSWRGCGYCVPVIRACVTSVTWMYGVHYESMSKSIGWNGGRENPAYRLVRHFYYYFSRRTDICAPMVTWV
jgi:hypothetical protein